jgi:hypothetical protein
MPSKVTDFNGGVALTEIQDGDIFYVIRSGTDQFGDMELIKNYLSGKAISFADSVPFNNMLSIMNINSVDSNLTFTINATNQLIGAVTMVRLIANGINNIDISAFKEVSGSSGYNNQLDIQNNLVFFYDGDDYWVNIYQEAGSVPTPPPTLSWENLLNAINSTTFIALSGSLPAGGRSVVDIDATIPFDVRTIVPSDLNNINGVVLYLSTTETESGEYSWTAPTITYPCGFFILFDGNHTIYGTTQLFTSTTTSTSVVAGDIIRLINSGDDALLQISVDSGENWTTLRTFTNALNGVTTLYIKVLFATSDTAKQISVQLVN